VLRLRGDYLAIVTLAFGEIIRLVLINWFAVTKGTPASPASPRRRFFGLPFNATRTGFASDLQSAALVAYYKIFLYYLILALAC
jgi:branched-chain amino acid transport system permease protein